MAIKAEVTILGNRYKLTSDDNGAEQLEQLAARLNARMESTAGRGRLLNPLNVSVLTALQLMEELTKVQAEARNVCDSLKAKHQAEISRYRSAHEQSMAKLKSEYSAELARLKHEHAEELSKAKDEQARLRKLHAEELSAVQAEQAKLQKDYDELMELLDEA